MPCQFCRNRQVAHCVKLSSRGAKPIAFSKDHRRLIGGSKDDTVGSLLPLFNVRFLGLWSRTESALQAAVLAWSTRRLDPAAVNVQLPINIAHTVGALAWAVEHDTDFLRDRHVFAANLLGWVSYSTCSYETQAHTHFNGSMAILSFLMEPENRGYMTPELEDFGAFIIDCANAWATRNGGIPQRKTTFAQRWKYFSYLEFRDTSGVWYSATLEAANATLGNLMEITLRVVCEIARNEEEGSPSRNRVEEVLHYARAELGDAELHSVLRTIYNSFQGELTNHTTVEGQLTTRVFHRLRCVLLLLTILEQPSIQTGVSTLKAQYLGKVIISFCRKQAIRRGGPIEDYYLTSWHNFTHLLLGGMCLTMDDYPECESPTDLMLTLSVRVGYE